MIAPMHIGQEISQSFSSNTPSMEHAGEWRKLPWAVGSLSYATISPALMMTALNGPPIPVDVADASLAGFQAAGITAT